jgi:hypothetical protein
MCKICKQNAKRIMIVKCNNCRHEDKWIWEKVFNKKSQCSKCSSLYCNIIGEVKE